MRLDPSSIYPSRPKVLVSACLLGESVRYDGGDKRQTLFQQHLAPWLDLCGHCPEMAAGMGVPRAPVQLVEDSGIRVREVSRPEREFTSELTDAASAFITKDEGWVAAILKARSPSCGSESTPIHSTVGETLRLGDGVFSGVLKKRFPELSVVDETWLASRELCECFVIFCYLSAAARERRMLSTALTDSLGWKPGLNFQEYARLVGVNRV